MNNANAFGYAKNQLPKRSRDHWKTSRQLTNGRQRSATGHLIDVTISRRMVTSIYVDSTYLCYLGSLVYAVAHLYAHLLWVTDC